MSDQADLLRRLVRDTTTDRAPSTAPTRLVVVCGGKGGVGTTTVAVQLAAALAALGRPCMLVDADLGRADATALCGLSPRVGLTDLLAGRTSAERLLLSHPTGMQVLPAAWAPSASREPSATEARRLGDELTRISSEGNWVVVDVGNRRGDFLRGLWQRASRVLLVTTPDDVAVMDTYASIKLQADGIAAAIGIVVNRAARAAVAAEVQDRLERSCQRFLGLAIERSGQIPESPQLAASANGNPAAVPVRDGSAAPAFARLARLITRESPSSSTKLTANASNEPVLAQATV